VQTRKRSRVRADWVYRNSAKVFGTGIQANDQLGTYESAVQSQNTGVANATSHILYDSNNYIGVLTRGGIGSAATSGTTGVLGRHIRAEGRKPMIMAMQGAIFCEPQTWTLGNVMAVGIRIGVFEQDISGVFSLDIGYSMWAPEAGVPFSTPAHWANNTRNNKREWRFWKSFGDASTPPLMVLRLFWRGRAYLEGNECFGLFTELQSTSVGTRMQYWCRTLVADES